MFVTEVAGLIHLDCYSTSILVYKDYNVQFRVQFMQCLSREQRTLEAERSTICPMRRKIEKEQNHMVPEEID